MQRKAVWQLVQTAELTGSQELSEGTCQRRSKRIPQQQHRHSSCLSLLSFLPCGEQFNILARKCLQPLSLAFTLSWPDVRHMSKGFTGAKVSLTCVCDAGVHSDAQPFTYTQLCSQSCDITLKMQHFLRHCIRFVVQGQFECPQGG